MSTIKYQPEIDGLRALAVLVVVLFHFDVPGMSGGFIGVDVFFVISGFLITRIIVAEIAETGRLSFSGFYVRRARRILPALFVTVLFSTVLAFLLFSPALLAQFGGSAVTAVLSVSNVFFWQQSGYFDTEAITKPLLHTWSLGVEEQFYLVWPVLMLVLVSSAAPRRAIWGVVAAGLLSFALNAWFIEGDATGAIVRAFPAAAPFAPEAPATVFFLTPFRIFEFVIGAALVWLPDRRLPRLALEAAFVAGIALVVGSALAYTPETTFPYFAALVPCAGAALVIVAVRAPTSGWLLRNPVMVGLGLISYSVYLVHWPLVVFWRQYTAAPLGAWEILALLAATLVLALAMYRLVELPFRRGRALALRPRTVLAAVVAAALVLVAPAWSMWQGTDPGWVWRIPKARQSMTSREWRTIERRTYCSHWNPDMPRSLFSCQNFRGAGAPDVFVWGDSHALHLVAGVSEAYPDHNVYVLHVDGCVYQSGFEGYVYPYADKALEAACIGRNEAALAFFATRPRTTVILSSAKRATPEEVAPGTVLVRDALLADGHDVLVLGDVIIPGLDMGLCRTVPDYLIGKKALDRRCAADPSRIEAQFAYNAAMARLVEGYFDPAPVQCPAGTCAFYRKKVPLFRDNQHLSIDGSIALVAEMLRALGRVDR